MWLQFSVLLGGIATALLNFTATNDTTGFTSATGFTLAALLAIAYSALIYVYRAYRLRARDSEGLYYDPYGPSVLCFAITAAMGSNVALRLIEN